MTAEETSELTAGHAACARARGCPGWFVGEDVHVRRCDTCRVLATNEQARESALAAGLDVQQSGYVAGVSGTGEAAHGPRSSAQRATARINALLRSALEQLQDAQRVLHAPPPLRGCVDQLAVEVARAQGVSEWLSEDLVRLVDGDAADKDDAEPE